MTLHGDIHLGNMLRTGERLELIDLDFTCVGSAIHDIFRTLLMICKTAELEAALLRTYLQSCALPHTEQDLFALRLDVQRCALLLDWGSAHAIWPSLWADNSLTVLPDKYSKLVAVANEALEDTALAPKRWLVGDSSVANPCSGSSAS